MALVKVLIQDGHLCTNIAGATTRDSHSYCQMTWDMYLRATATYDDGEGEGKTAHMVSANPVGAKPYENAVPRL